VVTRYFILGGKWSVFSKWVTNDTLLCKQTTLYVPSENLLNQPDTPLLQEKNCNVICHFKLLGLITQKYTWLSQYILVKSWKGLNISQ